MGVGTKRVQCREQGAEYVGEDRVEGQREGRGSLLAGRGVVGPAPILLDQPPARTGIRHPSSRAPGTAKSFPILQREPAGSDSETDLDTPTGTWTARRGVDMLHGLGINGILRRT